MPTRPTDTTMSSHDTTPPAANLRSHHRPLTGSLTINYSCYKEYPKWSPPTRLKNALRASRQQHGQAEYYEMVVRKVEKRIARRIKHRASKGSEKPHSVWKNGHGAERLRSQDPKLKGCFAKKEEVVKNWEGKWKYAPHVMVKF